MTVGNAHVFPAFLTRVLTQLFFSKPPTTFLTCFCRGEGRKFSSTGDPTQNHPVMSPTGSPLSHQGGTNNSNGCSTVGVVVIVVVVVVGVVVAEVNVKVEEKGVLVKVVAVKVLVEEVVEINQNAVSTVIGRQ